MFDLNGKSVLISDLWKDRKAVVAFARHFGYVIELWFLIVGEIGLIEYFITCY